MTRRSPWGKRPSPFVRPVPGPLPGRRRRARRAAHGPDKARGERLPRPDARRSRAWRVGRPGGRQGPAGRVRMAVARRAVEPPPAHSGAYEGLLRLHVLPTLGDTPLNGLRPAKIRTWHAGLLKRPKPGASTAAKAYRLLRSILATAVEDELIPKNPCAIKGARVERSKERPVATSTSSTSWPMSSSLAIARWCSPPRSPACDWVNSVRSPYVDSTCSAPLCTSSSRCPSSSTASWSSGHPRAMPASARSRFRGH
jgi:hypothetical protein